MALLSELCFSHDVAIDVSGYDILEEATGSRLGTTGMVGKIKLLSLPTISIEATHEQAHRRLLAAYREGMNATNVLYQALNFSKVLEGCLKLHNEATARVEPEKARRELMRIPASASQIPVAQEFLEQFGPFLGWKFTRVLDHFRPMIRNAIAHLDPEQDVLDVDHFDDIQRCEKAIPVLRFMARTWMNAELFSHTV